MQPDRRHALGRQMPLRSLEHSADLPGRQAHPRSNALIRPTSKDSKLQLLADEATESTGLRASADTVFVQSTTEESPPIDAGTRTAIQSPVPPSLAVTPSAGPFGSTGMLL